MPGAGAEASGLGGPRPAGPLAWRAGALGFEGPVDPLLQAYGRGGAA